MDGTPSLHAVGTWKGGQFCQGTVTYFPEGDSYHGQLRSQYESAVDLNTMEKRESWEQVRHGMSKY